MANELRIGLQELLRKAQLEHDTDNGGIAEYLRDPSSVVEVFL